MTDDASYRVTAAELRSFIERAEHLEAEKKEVADLLKDVFAEAKARGYDVKILKKVMALRKRDADEVAEEEAVLDMYREALGLEPGARLADLLPEDRDAEEEDEFDGLI